MVDYVLLLSLLGGVAAVAVLFFLAGELLGSAVGKIALALGFVVLPLGLSTTQVLVGIDRSSTTEFCMDCHEMERYGRTLFANNDSLAAVHYQNRLISREGTCFECHTNYAMFGSFKAKLDGLMHVWVHYVSGAPENIELYEPYPNYNCLHCHEDGRAFIEHPSHKEFEALTSGATSCLECHAPAHDFEATERGEFWSGR
jgi:cytochrome c-type protein NapC